MCSLEKEVRTNRPSGRDRILHPQTARQPTVALVAPDTCRLVRTWLWASPVAMGAQGEASAPPGGVLTCLFPLYGPLPALCAVSSSDQHLSCPTELSRGSWRTPSPRSITKAHSSFNDTFRIVRQLQEELPFICKALGYPVPCAVVNLNNVEHKVCAPGL